MDGQKFDQIAKSLAAGATRRRLLKLIVGGAAGALAGASGVRHAETVLADGLCPGGGGPDNKICHCPPGQDGGNCQTTGNGGGHEGTGHQFDCCCLSDGTNPNPLCLCPGGGDNCCKPSGTSCDSNAHCCADAPNCCNGVCQVAACPQCVTAATCPQATDPCQEATCIAGRCGIGNKSNGTTCNDGNACTQTDTCQNGTCTGANPVACPTPDQCHDVGTCDPATGSCSNPAKTDGTACDDGLFCTVGDVCTAGVCGGTPRDCSPGLTDQCHDGICDEALNACRAVPANIGESCDDRRFCTIGETCQADGTCGGGSPRDCSSLGDQCNDGACDTVEDACVKQPVANGTTCESGNLCTADTCQGGACTEGDLDVSCTSEDPCKVSTCNPASGLCEITNAEDGTACNDGNACTRDDACVAGVCVGSDPVVCPTPEQCRLPGICDQATGICSNPAKPDGTACETGNRCTADTCQAGECTQGPLNVTCTSADPCLVSTCNPASGTCTVTNAADGTSCDDGDACTTGDVCTAGVCGGTTKICTALDQCHVAGTCDSSTGICSNPIKAVGTPCSDGTASTCDETCQADGTCGGGVICACTDAESPKRCFKGGPEYTCKRCAGVTQGSVQVVCDRSNTPSCVCNSKTCKVNGQTIGKGQPVPACSAVTCDTRPPA